MSLIEKICYVLFGIVPDTRARRDAKAQLDMNKPTAQQIAFGIHADKYRKKIMEYRNEN